MINKELFYTLEFMVNTCHQLQDIAKTLEAADNVVAMRQGWNCEGLVPGQISWVYHTVKAHDYIFSDLVGEKEKEAFMQKLETVLKEGKYLNLPESVRTNQLGEDIAEATGVK